MTADEALTHAHKTLEATGEFTSKQREALKAILLAVRMVRDEAPEHMARQIVQGARSVEDLRRRGRIGG